MGAGKGAYVDSRLLFMVGFSIGVMVVVLFYEIISLWFGSFRTTLEKSELGIRVLVGSHFSS